MFTLKKYCLLLAAVIGTALMLSEIPAGAFVEPAPPDTTVVVDPAREEALQNFAYQPIDVVFKALQDVEYRVDPALMHRAVLVAFENRRDEAVGYAMGRIRGRSAKGSRADLQLGMDTFVAKNILVVFPDQAAEQLSPAYEGSDPYRRGSLILAAGMIAGPAVRDLLIDALDDNRTCEPASDELGGDPLRICDVAYNQLVLRYDIPDVIRTIGVSSSAKTRDAHIEKLRGLLADQL